MKRNILKLVTAVILIMILSISYIMPYCYAAQTAIMNDGGQSDKVGAQDIKPEDYKPTKEGGDEFISMGNKVIGVLQQIGSMVSVITLVALGIKYMVGSIEEKAEYKSTMLPYCIGAVLVFSTVNVLAIISKIFE